MGGDEMIRRDELRRLGMDFAIQAGILHQCPHGEALKGVFPEDNGPAYAIATNWLKQTGGGDYSRKEVMDSVKDAIESAGFECSTCEKHKME
ncbi:hypothetical protein [Mesorhizobium sp. M7A.F.Ca.MR.362.00.0.0]|uniref:hypothetical protein n=1 Tax=Mesorhizobium sp. M7A.F.Ca.MR.362.00.0.0 TaxID=2496779 RepID=UPI000FD37653|nr:hypothetical protein [Mesorhizobium sp. M7A.F.Ca.MR.362.00.0.0]RUU76439.1 hypothetical protein EOC06_27025 [Mesorhizobium sp. M7A.F.Ca.MR.362.00.0.0]RWN95131.1 MAG: hypothetical protein EOS05_10045 [Mesorhizobium sp.]